MGDYLSSNLSTPLEFAAGGMIPGSVAIVSPEHDDYYLLVEQYSSELAFLPGTRSYFYQSVVGGTAVNSTVDHTEYHLNEGEEESVLFNLTLTYTDCYLYIFLKKMAGDDPAPDTDDTIDFVVVALESPSAAIIGYDLGTIMSVMVTMMVVVMMMKMAISSSK